MKKVLRGYCHADKGSGPNSVKHLGLGNRLPLSAPTVMRECASAAAPALCRLPADWAASIASARRSIAGGRRLGASGTDSFRGPPGRATAAIARQMSDRPSAATPGTAGRPAQTRLERRRPPRHVGAKFTRRSGNPARLGQELYSRVSVHHRGRVGSGHQQHYVGRRPETVGRAAEPAAAVDHGHVGAAPRLQLAKSAICGGDAGHVSSQGPRRPEMTSIPPGPRLKDLGETTAPASTSATCRGRQAGRAGRRCRRRIGVDQGTVPWPCAASATARFTATVVVPSPPCRRPRPPTDARPPGRVACGRCARTSCRNSLAWSYMAIKE